MSEPRVTLHDVSVEGDASHRDAVLTAIERAVADSAARGQVSPDAVRSAVAAAVAEAGPS